MMFRSTTKIGAEQWADEWIVVMWNNPNISEWEGRPYVYKDCAVNGVRRLPNNWEVL